MMNFEHIAREWFPPKIAWRLTRKSREKRELAEFSSFYKQFIGPGDLCFDVGANLGNRTRSFLHLGCRVVAIEPQSHCLKKLQHKFRSNDRVVIEHAALGHEDGHAELMVSSNHVLSSLSNIFVERTSESGRFSNARWNLRESVNITTLDQLIEKHGTPRFIKIDVEGFESEVLAGLSQKIDSVSFEWVPELPENTISCVRRLSGLGDYEYNLSWGESMKFARTTWRTPESILNFVSELQGESTLFGDIYARLRK